MISTERERERAKGESWCFIAEELESSLNAEETRTRYVLVQVGKVKRSPLRIDPRLNMGAFS